MARAETSRLGRDFTLLWSGHSVSKVGSQITIIALPAVALLHLHASNLEVGLLTACNFLAFLLFGLPVGVWVDRARKRRIMVVTDVIRCVVLVAVPVGAVFDVLSMPLLYLVAFVQGLCTVFFDVAYRSILPALVPRDKLMVANGRLEFAVAGAQVAGPTLGGFLIATLTAPFTLLVDAVSFLVSALCLGRTRVPADRDLLGEKPTLRRGILSGLEFLFRDRVMRGIMFTTGTITLFLGTFQAVVLIFLVREIGINIVAAGILLAAVGVGAFVGSLAADRLANAIGPLRLLRVSAVLNGCFLLLTPLTGAGAMLAFFVVGQLGSAAAFSVYTVVQISYRQSICPPSLLGRMNASLRFVVFGTLPIGSLVGGLIATYASARVALVAVAVGSLVGPLWLSPSPLTHIRQLVARTR
jgi:MFS family permease